MVMGTVQHPRRQLTAQEAGVQGGGEGGAARNEGTRRGGERSWACRAGSAAAGWALGAEAQTADHGATRPPARDLSLSP